MTTPAAAPEPVDAGRGLAAAAASPVTLECVDLVKTFGGVRAVDDVTLSFEAGKVTALVGPNGAGKTTLFHLLAGALTPDTGEILYRGRPIHGLPPWTIAQMGIGRLFQDVRVFPKLSVLENLLVARPRQRGEAVAGSLFARRSVEREEKAATAEAREWLDLVGLADHARQPAAALSYGQQKLLAIVRLAAADADVLLLDEPAAGVSVAMVERLLGVTRGFAERGKAVVVIEHNMNVVFDAADWVYFLSDGQVAAFGLPADVLADPAIMNSFLGLTTVTAVLSLSANGPQ